MFTTLIRKVVGTKNDREVKRLSRLVQRINALEPEMQALTDDGIRDKTAQFRQRLEQGETLDAILPEAFALVREASQRTLFTPFRCADDWRHGVACRQDCRNENR